MLIEKNIKNITTVHGAFEVSEGDLEAMVHKSWKKKAYFHADNFELNFSLQPFRYKMIRSLDFYKSMNNKLVKFDQLTQIKAEVQSIEDSLLTTDIKSYHGDMIFSSIFNYKSLSQQKKYLFVTTFCWTGSSNQKCLL